MTAKRLGNGTGRHQAQRTEDIGDCLRASFNTREGSDGSFDSDLANLLGKLSTTPYEIISRNRQ